MRTRLWIVVVASMAPLTACRGEQPAPTPPAVSMLARLAVPGLDNRGASIASSGANVVVTWVAGTDAQTDVFAAASHDGGRTFEAPVRVNHTAGDARYSGEQAPRVAIGRSVVVAWQARSEGATAIRLARSTDGARQFGPTATVHAKGLAGTRGWASLAVDADDNAHVAWLDTRPDGHPSAAPSARASAHQHGSGGTPQNLFHARVGPDGVVRETRVATQVCFCCKTSVAMDAAGNAYVAWRHIFPPNLRDIALARIAPDGASTAIARVSEDGWAIDGCPEDGPSIGVDARGHVHVAWPTVVGPTAGGRKSIFYTVSSDGGRTFAPRRRVDENAPEGRPAHPQLIVDGTRVLVTWDEGEGDDRRIRLREISSPNSSLPVVTISAPGHATYPAVALSPSGPLVAYTAGIGAASIVEVARIDDAGAN